MKTNTKRIEQFVKEYFYFSQTERKGIFALLLLLLTVTAFPFIYKQLFPPQPFEFTIETLPESKSGISAILADKVVGPFSFDPNTAETSVLKQLGFSDKNIQTIQRYLQKGGRFKKPEDLRKLYGLDKKLVEQLIPFVSLPHMQSSSTTFSDSTKKYHTHGPVEINTADTNALIALYRIGPTMARRIVEYRERLGGFLTLNQLTEVYGFDEDILYDLKGKIVVDASRARIFDLNAVSLDELKTHPYFKYKLSNAIVNYRLQHGPYQSLSDLKKIIIVNDSIYQNITRYLKIN
jgi:competence protein ComEA